jgi:hypothetical protein
METVTFTLKEAAAFVGLLACIAPPAILFGLMFGGPDLQDDLAELVRGVRRWLP